MVILSLLAWFHSCTTFDEKLLLDHKESTMTIVSQVCQGCTTVGAIRSSDGKVAISVITPKLERKVVVIDYNEKKYLFFQNNR